MGFAEKVFPELRNVSSHPLDGTRLAMSWIVVRLNEDTGYSREAIADWLCSEGGCEHPLEHFGIVEAVAFKRAWETA